MPRVRFLTSVAGATFSARPGEVLDLPADEARVWADGQRAELVREAPVERTTRRARMERS